MKTKIPGPMALLLLLTAAGCYVYDAGGGPQVRMGGAVLVAPPPPAVIIDHDPDEVWLIPRTGIFFIPNISVDIFFLGGRWYHRAEGNWYWGASYRGPWTWLQVESVPPGIRHLPPGYRNEYEHKRVPYGQWKKRGYHWEDEDEDRENGRDDKMRKRGD